MSARTKFVTLRNQSKKSFVNLTQDSDFIENVGSDEYQSCGSDISQSPSPNSPAASPRFGFPPDETIDPSESSPIITAARFSFAPSLIHSSSSNISRCNQNTHVDADVAPMSLSRLPCIDESSTNNAQTHREDVKTTIRQEFERFSFGYKSQQTINEDVGKNLVPRREGTTTISQSARDQLFDKEFGASVLAKASSISNSSIPNTSNSGTPTVEEFGQCKHSQRDLLHRLINQKTSVSKKVASRFIRPRLGLKFMDPAQYSRSVIPKNETKDIELPSEALSDRLLSNSHDKIYCSVRTNTSDSLLSNYESDNTRCAYSSRQGSKENMRATNPHGEDYVKKIDRMVADILSVGDAKKAKNVGEKSRTSHRGSGLINNFDNMIGAPADECEVSKRKARQVSDGEVKVTETGLVDHPWMKIDDNGAEEEDFKSPGFLTDSITQFNASVVSPPKQLTPLKARTPSHNLNDTHESPDESPCMDVKRVDDNIVPTKHLKDTKGLARITKITTGNRSKAVSHWYATFNEEIFGNRLPPDLPIEWNKKFTRTSGRTVFVSADTHEVYSDDSKAVKCLIPKQIELSVKLIKDINRLKKTLLHEMCHVAQRVIDSDISDTAHGHVFKKWAKIATQRYPDYEVTTYHEYTMDVPQHEYVCTSCSMTIKRHSKSINLEKNCCGSCGGKLGYTGKRDCDGNLVGKTNAYNLYIQANFARVMQKVGDKSKVMSMLAQEWREKKLLDEEE